MPDPSGINPLVGRVAPPPEMPSFDLALDTAARNEQLQAYRKARVDAASDAAATQTALQQAGGDIPTALDILGKSGKVNALGALQKGWDDHQAKAQTLAKQHLDMQVASHELAADWAHALIGHPERFAAAKQALSPELGNVLGDQYDEARLQTIADSSKQGAQWNKDAAAALAQAPKDLESAVRLSAGLAANAPDQASWDSIPAYYESIGYKQLGAQVRRQLGAFSPENKARVASMALTPEQQQQATERKATAAEAAARDAETSRHNQATEKTAAGELIIKQAAAAPFATGTQTPISTAPPEPTTGNIPKAEYGGLTPNSVYQGGISVALGGKNAMPNFGMGSSPAVNAKRNAILNQASAMATAAGVNQADLQQEYAGASAAVKKLTTNYALASAASTTANDNLDYALKLSPTVSRSDIPVANRLRQWWQAELGGASLPNLSAFETAIYTASREYAKVTSNAYASVAELSTAAAKKADELLNAAQQPAQFKAVTDVMRGDMGRVTAPMKAEIGSAKDIGPNLKKFTDFVSGGGKIGGEPPPTTQQPKAATGPKPPQGAKVDDLWQSPTGLMKFLGPGKGWGPG